MFFGSKKPPANGGDEANSAPQPSSGPPTFTEKDKATAKLWFKKAAESRDKHMYDYAVESMITGLGIWPEAVSEGHMPLRALALQRVQAGGKKPGMMDLTMKRGVNGKDIKQNFLNSAWRVAMDPTDNTGWDGYVKNAAKGRYFDTLKWLAPLAAETLVRDKKPNPSRFKAFREALIEAADYAAEHKDNATSTKLLEYAVESLENLITLMPGDDALRDEQRNLAGKLAISKGKYEQADTFRDSLQDAAGQRTLHDTERAKQGESSLDAMLAALRKAWEAEPNSAAHYNRYLDALERTEQARYENIGIEMLDKLYAETNQYSHKFRADKLRLAQRRRAVREMVSQAKASNDESAKQQARLAVMEHNQFELEIYRERVERYPTELALRYRLGEILFEMKEYHEAIPHLQEAQAEPRSRHKALLLIGRAFHETGAYDQAIDVLKEALDTYDMQDDLAKKLMYHLGIAHQAAGQKDHAKTVLGRLQRMDYNYANGDVRKRMEELGKE